MAEYIIQDTTLTAIGDAIRAKTGGTELITPENMPTEIENIKSGGTKETPTEKDFNFYDYDGTLLYSYTREEVLQLTELPPLPTQPGLICQGWNWTYEDIIQEANDGYYVDAGANYITDDGKTRLYVEIEEDNYETCIGFTPKGNIILNWGDGTKDVSINGATNNTARQFFDHTYATKGNYIITIEVTEGTVNINGNGYGSALFASDKLTRLNRLGYTIFKKFEGGDNLELSTKAFYYCHGLETITLPQETYIGEGYFMYCNYLKAFIYPLVNEPSKTTIKSNFTQNFNIKVISLLKNQNIVEGNFSSNNQTFRAAYSLKRLVIPKSNDFVGTGYMFMAEDVSLKDVFLPNGITTIYNNGFSGCTKLVNISIPDTVTSIGILAFNGCTCLKRIKIPSSLTSIGNTAFIGCTFVQEYDFTSISLNIAEDGTKSLPITFGTDVFKNLNADCKILFADAETAEVAKATTNLAQYADYIHYVGETEVTS